MHRTLRPAYLTSSFMIFLSLATFEALAQTSRRDLRNDFYTAYLGIQMEDVTAENMAKHQLSSEKGVIVRSVEKGSPAESAGIRENDVILEYSAVPVLSSAQLARMVQETPAGRTLELLIARAGKKQSVTVKLGSGGSQIARRMEILPDFRGFGFEGPGDRTYRFPIPDGRGREFGFNVPAPEAARPRLGITLEPLTEQMRSFLAVPANKGVLITSVAEGTPAGGKLKAGDVIVKADGTDMADPSDLQRLIERKSDDAKVELLIIRDKKELAVTVTLSGGHGPGYRL